MTHRFTRLMILSACATLLAAVPAVAGLCADGVSLTTYTTSGYSCTIGGVTFSNFEYTASGTNPIAASSVTVDSLGPAGSGASFPSLIFPSDVGLQFSAPWNATSNNVTSDAAIEFEVTIPGATSIEDAGLDQVSGITGTGAAGVVETGCNGPFNPPLQPCNTTWGLLTNNTNQATGTIFAPTGSVIVGKDISVTAGSNGTASLSVVQDVFSTVVPEPRGLPALLGFVLVAGLALRKKLQSVRG
jgi:hypothetical protein